MLTDDEVAEEIRVFIEHLDGINSTVTSDHIMNLLEEVGGRLPQDQPKMLQVIRSYQALPDTDRLIYRAGRRGGAFRSVQDMERDSATYRKIKRLIEDVQSKEGNDGVERLITEMVDQYI
jgi:hypothetical protein